MTNSYTGGTAIPAIAGKTLVPGWEDVLLPDLSDREHAQRKILDPEVSAEPRAQLVKRFEIQWVLLDGHGAAASPIARVLMEEGAEVAFRNESHVLLRLRRS